MVDKSVGRSVDSLKDTKSSPSVLPSFSLLCKGTFWDLGEDVRGIRSDGPSDVVLWRLIGSSCVGRGCDELSFSVLENSNVVL